MFQEASNFLDFVEELYAQDTAGVSLIEFNAKDLTHSGLQKFPVTLYRFVLLSYAYGRIVCT
mgnify:CR=1 FL=1